MFDYSLSMQNIPGAINGMEDAAKADFLPALNSDALVSLYEELGARGVPRSAIEGLDNKVAAREGLVKIGRETDFGEHTQLWTRVNALDSPWFLDDVLRLVGEIGLGVAGARVARGHANPCRCAARPGSPAGYMPA